MTLILSLLTSKFVLQVSDRRLTNTRTGLPDDDHTNKAVLLDLPAFAFGFTGYAKLGMDATDMWLAKRLTNLKLDPSLRVSELFQPLAAEAGTEFARMRHAPIPQAFAGVGWVRIGKGGPFTPVFVRVSNFETDQDDIDITALDQFRSSARTVTQGEKLLLVATGCPVPADFLVWLKRRLRRALKSANPALSCLRLMSFAIRVAANHNSVVGKGLMAVSIPLPTGKDQGIVLSAPPNSEIPTFQYLAADPSDRTQLGPIYVGIGGPIMSKFLARPLTPEEMADD